MLERHARRQGQAARGGKAAVFRQPALTGKGRDRLAHRQARHPVTQRVDHARDLHPHDKGQGRAFLVLALDHQQIGKVQPAGADAQPHLARAGRGHGQVGQGRGGIEGRKNEGAHGFSCCGRGGARSGHAGARRLGRQGRIARCRGVPLRRPCAFRPMIRKMICILHNAEKSFRWVNCRMQRNFGAKIEAQGAAFKSAAPKSGAFGRQEIAQSAAAIMNCAWAFPATLVASLNMIETDPCGVACRVFPVGHCRKRRCARRGLQVLARKLLWVRRWLNDRLPALLPGRMHHEGVPCETPCRCSCRQAHPSSPLDGRDDPAATGRCRRDQVPADPEI